MRKHEKPILQEQLYNKQVCSSFQAAQSSCCQPINSYTAPNQQVFISTNCNSLINSTFPRPLCPLTFSSYQYASSFCASLHTSDFYILDFSASSSYLSFLCMFLHLPLSLMHLLLHNLPLSHVVLRLN